MGRVQIRELFHVHKIIWQSLGAFVDLVKKLEGLFGVGETGCSVLGVV